MAVTLAGCILISSLGHPQPRSSLSQSSTLSLSSPRRPPRSAAANAADAFCLVICGFSKTLYRVCRVSDPPSMVSSLPDGMQQRWRFP